MSIKQLQGQLVFVQLDTPKPCYDVDKGTEWKCSITISEDDADEWDAAYPKQPAKQVKTTEYERTYKVQPPFPDQRKQHVVTLRKNTKLANGNPVPAQYEPKVYVEKGSTLVDSTHSVLVANGSGGLISVDHWDGKMGPVARLKNVKVTDLIVYEKASAEYKPGSEFDTASDGNGGSTRVPASAKTKEAPKVKPKAKPQEDEDDSFDLPF